MRAGPTASTHAALERSHVEYWRALPGLQDHLPFGVRSARHRPCSSSHRLLHNQHSSYVHSGSSYRSRDKYYLGVALLMSQICTHLSGTAPAWGKLIAPWAEYVAQTLWAGPKSGRTRTSILPTRLTQQRRTEAKGKIWTTRAEPPKVEHFCRGCGKKIANGRLNCANCAVEGATERLAGAAKQGRVAARRPEARAKQVASRKRHAQACSAWDASMQPTWLTSDTVLATNPAATREHSHIRDSITNWRLTLVRGPNPERLSSTSEALAGAGGTGWPSPPR
jgi:hypothetical protein